MWSPCSDAETGEIEALINASAITAVRTAAVSGLATRELARARRWCGRDHRRRRAG